VVGPQSICVYSSGVAELFPEDADLITMGAAGFLGMPLFSREGRKIGLLAIMTTQPLEDADTLTALLRFVGTRTSLELEYELATANANDEATGLADLLAEEDARLRVALT
jgi:hypothetical protein